MFADGVVDGPRVVVNLADVEAAAATIRGSVVATPTLHSRTLSEIAGADLWVKYENQQFTGVVQGTRRAQLPRASCRPRTAPAV